MGITFYSHKIHFVLRLIVEFMDRFPFVEDFFSEAGCVTRSNQISLASLLRLVWDRLKTMPDSMSRRTVKNSGNEAGTMRFEASKVSQSSQASSSVNYCESCTLAGEAILQAINAIEQVFLENKLISVAATEREECKNDIYEKTQWAVMSRLTKGIGTDVETALRMANESSLRAQAAGRDHEQMIRQLRASLTTQEKRTNALHAENLELKKLVENGRHFLFMQTREDFHFGACRYKNIVVTACACCSTKLFLSVLRLADIGESRSHDKKSQEILRHAIELQKPSLILTVQYGPHQGPHLGRKVWDTLDAGENNILQSQAVALAESKLELEKTVIGLRKEIVDTRDAYLETERRCRALLDESCKRNESVRFARPITISHLAGIRRSKLRYGTSMINDGDCSRMKEDHEGAVARLQREIASLRESLISIGRENDGGTIKTSRGDAVLKPEDDPVADMTQQLISNREKIELTNTLGQRTANGRSKDGIKMRELSGRWEKVVHNSGEYIIN
ncbi:hypothetical protein WN51_01373 [Melipona quadrifasciata]|uniref:Uncharacterized protein n=1 Tax=Melipona quadrifasciata TaxID=166423 RepID=A0A0M8ZXB0_9HYME|nr:hypothetical protein WN51_01373 [Melipona quadrifasciata]